MCLQADPVVHAFAHLGGLNTITSTYQSEGGPGTAYVAPAREYWGRAQAGESGGRRRMLSMKNEFFPPLRIKAQMISRAPQKEKTFFVLNKSRFVEHRFFRNPIDLLSPQPPRWGSMWVLVGYGWGDRNCCGAPAQQQF